MKARPCTWFICRVSVVLHLITFFIVGSDFVISDPMCFRKFAIINRIDASFDEGGLESETLPTALSNLPFPLGYATMALWLLAAILHWIWTKQTNSYART